jgi:hypothetical protein
MASDDALRAQWLDEHMASDESLRDHRQREAKGLMHMAEKTFAAEPLELNQRRLRLMLIGQVISMFVGPCDFIEIFFIAVLFHDRVWHMLPTSPHEALIRCIAFASIATKMTHSRRPFLQRLAAVMARLRVHLTVKDVTITEREILRTLGFRTNLPTVFSWLTLFAKRFNAFSEFTLVDHMKHVQRCALQKAYHLALQAPIHQMQHEGLAACLLAYGFLETGLMESAQAREWLKSAVGFKQVFRI